MNTDIVYLHGIQVDCILGVWDWERQITQRISIDLSLGYDLTKAGETDDLSDTLNYQAVSERVRAYCIERQAKLVETLATGIANILLNEFNCQSCRIQIHKTGAVRGANDVGVTIERTAKDGV